MQKLKQHRMAKGLTLHELASRIGCSTAACSNWETGRATPLPRFIPKLAKSLGINPMDLTLLLSPPPALVPAH
jgi:transcriptional regulator with XRE-family HTH domain